MDDLPQEKPGYGVVILIMAICLCVAMLMGALIYWMDVPVWQVRLSGIETHAIAHREKACEDTDGSSFSFTYAFTDTRGERYNVTREDLCTNVYADRSTVTIWYMPNDPTHMIADIEMQGVFISTPLLAFVGLFILYLVLNGLIRIFFRPHQSAS